MKLSMTLVVVVVGELNMMTKFSKPERCWKQRRRKNARRNKLALTLKPFLRKRAAKPKTLKAKRKKEMRPRWSPDTRSRITILMYLDTHCFATLSSNLSTTDRLPFE